MPKVRYKDDVIEITQNDFDLLDRHQHLAHYRDIIPAQVLDHPWVSLAKGLETSTATVDRYFNEHPED